MRTLGLFLVAALLLALPAAAAVNRTDADFDGTGQSGPFPEDGSDACPPMAFITGPLPFMDTGDTCDNTNTVTDYTGGSCGVDLPFPYGGEDEIYEITLGAGNNVAFSADLTGSSGDLVLFLLSTCGDGGSCLAHSQDAIGPGVGPEVIDAAAYAPGTYYLYVDSYYNAGSAGSCGTFSLDVTGTLPAELIEFSIN